MKRLLVLGFVVVMVFALGACGNKTVAEEAETVEAAGELWVEGAEDEVKEYTSSITEKADTLAADLGSFVQKHGEAIEDTAKADEEAWKTDVNGILAKLKTTSESIIDEKAPEALADVHAEYVKAAEFVKEMAGKFEGDATKIISDGEADAKTALDRLENAKNALAGK